MTILKLGIAAGAAALCATAHAQQAYEVKVASFVTPQHFMSKWLVAWGEKLEKASNGRLVFKHFPSAQMAPPPAHYDLARTGRAEVSWFLHGGTPGRFPLTDLISLPYMVGSSEIGTKVLNDRQLRSNYLDAEHRGVELLLLFTSTPVNVYTTGHRIDALDAFKGLRIRFAGPSMRDFVAALGATPVGVQPGEMLEMLKKGSLDGIFTDYGGAGIAFKMGGTIKHSTEMYSNVVSFGIAANQEFHARLPAELSALLADSMQGVEQVIGRGFDGLDVVGKKLLVDAGAEVIRPSPEQRQNFRRIGEQIHEATLDKLSARNSAAREAHKLMTALSEQHAKTSRNFWR